MRISQRRWFLIIRNRLLAEERFGRGLENYSMLGLEGGKKKEKKYVSIILELVAVHEINQREKWTQ